MAYHRSKKAEVTRGMISSVRNVSFVMDKARVADFSHPLFVQQGLHEFLLEIRHRRQLISIIEPLQNVMLVPQIPITMDELLSSSGAALSTYTVGMGKNHFQPAAKTQVPAGICVDMRLIRGNFSRKGRVRGVFFIELSTGVCEVNTPEEPSRLIRHATILRRSLAQP